MERAIRPLRKSRPWTGGLATLSDRYGERLESLSRRERSVLDLAAEGCTDEQIAQTLGLSTSTISSYWVRIRGKIGQFSRTQIVAELLRHQAQLENDSLRAEVRRLQGELRRSKVESGDTSPISLTSSNPCWFSTALAQLPEATLITGPPATVLYANERARLLYRAEEGELEGLRMRALTTAATPESLREPCREVFRDTGAEEEIVGIEEPYYARRGDGSNFRAVLRVRRFALPSGLFATVVVREFLGETETVLKALREPLQTN